MKHWIFGGDGFLGSQLTRDLLERGESVAICDINKSDHAFYDQVEFHRLDVADRAAFDSLAVEADDIVHHLAARLLVPIMPRREREEFFFSVNYRGTENLLDFMKARGLGKLTYYTTDMVYGHTEQDPRFENHPRVPLGPYGDSKYQSELLCERYREDGMRITIFRPRLIIGPGRLGILTKLFRLIDANLPVPLIGNGKNFYQFISVYDCSTAILAAVDNGIPNSEYNLGSLNPPTVNQLLGNLIKSAGSRSILLPTPASLVKGTLNMMDILGIPLMDPEQYLIADETCVLDVSRAEKEIGWRPQHNDEDMLLAAYQEYRAQVTGNKGSGAPATA